MFRKRSPSFSSFHETVADGNPPKMRLEMRFKENVRAGSSRETSGSNPKERVSNSKEDSTRNALGPNEAVTIRGVKKCDKIK